MSRRLNRTAEAEVKVKDLWKVVFVRRKTVNVFAHNSAELEEEIEKGMEQGYSLESVRCVNRMSDWEEYLEGMPDGELDCLFAKLAAECSRRKGKPQEV
jgi:hypothetical protein